MKSIITAFCFLSAIVGGLGQTDDYFLDTNIVPLSYNLEITPFFVNENYNGIAEMADTFLGNAKIDFRVHATTANPISKVVLHINDLKIQNYELSSRIGFLNFTESDYNATTDKWTIDLNGVVETNRTISIEINYRGYMRDDMAGFYKSYYYENGTKVWMASTQFQPSDARRAFPCFDEPRFKAPFTITINRPTDMISVSNTRIVSTVAALGKVKDTFEVTPPLPTYLIAFIVSKYERNNSTMEFGVYARPTAKPNTQLALDFGRTMLAKFGEYLAIDYYSLGNNTKMDMASIPDFSAGAMENWGLLTYRESSFLYYNDITTDLTEQRIKGIIAHEQAHQWFGDLVTCSWWSHTWLNEGFARYFQYFGVEMVQTGWEMEEQFVVENLQQSMHLDSTDGTHAMTDDTVKTKTQSSNMFDNISYNKAASIIRMLKHYIGVDKFQQTLQAHLADNNDTAITPDHLIFAIEKVNPNANVGPWFSSWTTNPGFPLVTVKLDNQTLKLTQKRFMRLNQTSTAAERYSIPVTFMIDNENPDDVTPKFVFWANETGEKSFDLPKKPAKYYILNPKQTGYYRVNYDADNWNKIKAALEKDNFDGIPVMSRAQIVDDLLNLARSGVVSYKTAIDIVRYLKKETHYIPWLAATNNGLTFLSQRVNVNNSEHQRLFSWLITDTMKVAYEQLTFDAKTADKQTEKYNRANIQSWICKYGNEDCIKKSQEHFDKFMAGTAVPKNQRTTVYCNGVRHGNESHFNFLYDRYKQEDMSSEQLNFLIGMACTKNQELVNKYLDRLTKTDEIRPQDRASTINNILNSNPEGVDFLYNYVTVNHVAWFNTTKSYSTLNTIAGRFTTTEQFTKYKAWLSATQTQLGASHASLLSEANAAEKNLEWDDKYMTELMAHLKEISSATAKAVSVILSIISFTVLYFMN